MKRKPIRIDWDELEAAFDSKSEDLVYYLDLVTGDVVLEGEGEGADQEGDEDLLDDAGERDAVVRNAPTRLYVPPPDSEEESDWARDFVEDEELGDHVKAQLTETLTTGSVVSFRDTLRQHPEAKDRWFLYRSDRLHEVIDAWVEENGIVGVEPPPWR